MDNKRDFSDLGINEDTNLLLRHNTKINDISCAFEIWNWDGIYGESIIFYSVDVNHLSDKDLIALIAPTYKKNDSEPTINRDKKYTFINLNFETRD